MSLHVKSFLRLLKVEKGLSTNTVESYQRDLEDVQKYFNRNDISKLTRDQFREYLDTVKARCTTRTMARRMSALRQFYSFLEKEGTITGNPLDRIESPSFRTTAPKTLTEEEVEKLLDTSYQDPSFEGLRFCAMLELLYATGMRVSELVSLPINCFSESRGIRVINLIGKGDKERMVPINPKAFECIEKYLSIRNMFTKDQGSPWLFPSRSGKGYMTRQRFAQNLKDITIKSGIDPEKVSPHVLRHAFATHMLKKGANLMLIKTLLGHANLSTSEIYLHVLPEDLISLVQEHHPIQKGAVNC